MNSKEAFNIIKEAGTIYVGCASNIYTRYSFECDIIERDLKVLEILKRSPFILEKLAEYSTDREYNKRYFYGTITDNERNLVEEWLNESR